jgi:hypothetical protein
MHKHYAETRHDASWWQEVILNSQQHEIGQFSVMLRARPICLAILRFWHNFVGTTRFNVITKTLHLNAGCIYVCVLYANKKWRFS